MSFAAHPNAYPVPFPWTRPTHKQCIAVMSEAHFGRVRRVLPHTRIGKIVLSYPKINLTKS